MLLDKAEWLSTLTDDQFNWFWRYLTRRIDFEGLDSIDGSEDNYIFDFWTRANLGDRKMKFVFVSYISDVINLSRIFHEFKKYMEDFAVSDKRFQEVADCLNQYYGTKFTGQMVRDFVYDTELLDEIAENTYGDTLPRSGILDEICEELVGMSWPLNCDSFEYSQEFVEKAKVVGIL